MKHLVKGIIPFILTVILMLLVFTSGTATAQERDDLVFPDMALATELTNENEFTTEVVEETEVLPQPEESKTIQGSGLWYLTAKVQDGSDGSITRSYQVVKNGEGEVLSKIELPARQVTIEPIQMTYQKGAPVQVGATFTPRFTRYGADCAGCTRQSDGTSVAASGIVVSTTGVRQGNGSFKSGITYNGRYLFASNSDLPMCTLISISNHNYSGLGIDPSQTIYGFIGDRGVGPNHLDFFVGSEARINVVRPVGNKTPIVTITGFGTWTGRGCAF